MYRDPDNHISLEVGLGAGEPTGWGGGEGRVGRGGSRAYARVSSICSIHRLKKKKKNAVGRKRFPSVCTRVEIKQLIPTLQGNDDT